MTALARDVAGRPDLRSTLRRPGDALPGASIGTVPILWNNVDLADLRHGTDALTILDEIARTGYEGTQLGIGFPEGEALHEALAARRLRLAEVYLSIPATVDGPTSDALAIGRERVRLLRDGGGEVLVIALDISPEREEWAGRASAPGTPAMTDAGWAAPPRDGPHARERGGRGRPSGRLPSARRHVHRDAGRGGPPRRRPRPERDRDLPRCRPLHGRRRRPGGGAARPRRSRDPHPPQGRRPGRPRRPARRFHPGLRTPPSGRASSPSSAPAWSTWTGSWRSPPPATTTAG